MLLIIARLRNIVYNVECLTQSANHSVFMKLQLLFLFFYWFLIF